MNPFQQEQGGFLYQSNQDESFTTGGIPAKVSRRNPLTTHGQEDCTTGGGRRNPERILNHRSQEKSCISGARMNLTTGGISNYGRNEESCTTRGRRNPELGGSRNSVPQEPGVIVNHRRLDKTCTTGGRRNIDIEPKEPGEILYHIGDRRNRLPQKQDNSCNHRYLKEAGGSVYHVRQEESCTTTGSRNHDRRNKLNMLP
jgi:hypothetical protein